MTRQYYCWKVALTFACGCVETTPTTHLCGPDREGCNNWLTYKKTNKACEDHRRGAGGEGGGRRRGRIRRLPTLLLILLLLPAR
ncbi:hypothetical protein NEMBOFW57_007507 [Staphylotrichum longicolle]|uniref:Uncharacterized protein n=1 Tax=Staphylotrichum longicolle TaxID=669026 RepID=A0AAD4HXH5_9PEZI|nr:hypothetical protein NEMBOFW57_007507 [Staphylotrichum longicolle]